MRALVVLIHPVPSQMAIWREVAGMGVDLHMAATLTGPSSEAFVPHRQVPSFGTTHLFKAVRVFRRGQLWWLYPGLRRLIRRLQPDVVHVSSEPWGLLVSQVIGARAPVVVHGGDTMFSHGWRAEAAVRRRVARHNLGRTAGAAWWNSKGIQLSHANGLAADAPTLVAPFIAPDPEELHVAAARRAATRQREDFGSTVIGFVGRLTTAKGAQWLLDAVASAGLPAGSSVVLAGGGPLRSQLDATTPPEGVRLHILGIVDHARALDLIGCFDILVVPSLSTSSWEEQFGRVAVEGMHAGAAVIVSDSGALPEVVGDGAIVVAQNDTAALAAALGELAGDNRRRGELAARGQVWAARYAPDAVAAKVISLWQEVIDRR